MSPFSATFWAISPLKQACQQPIQQHLDSKTKPPGALGQLESIAAQLAHIQWHSEQRVPLIRIQQPTILVFAADHGIARQGVSIAPPEVTQQMVLNFLQGGAAINCFCRVNDTQLIVIDAGMLQPLQISQPGYLQQAVAAGTKDFSVEAAMSSEQCEQALLKGAEVARNYVQKGSNIIGFGEMGIGNTSAAAAMLCAYTGQNAEQLVGVGTGVSAKQYAKKVSLIQCALDRLPAVPARTRLTPAFILCQLGGFEIVQIIGAMLAAAKAGAAIVVDGFIVSVAALFACAIAPNVRPYMVFAHAGAERSHQHVLSLLDAEPLLDLSLRLGEGTGAALAIPLLRAAAEFFNHMATFESANVTV